MKTSPTTSETRVREALLDILHLQWREFGVPLRAPELEGQLEVIDPESLLWCSLEFTPTSPRLAEGVKAWFAANRTKINRQRLNKLARRARADHRTELWLTMDASDSGRTSEKSKSLGRRATGPSTLLLRSRDTLGNDCRSFLIVQLIGNPRGVRLRDVVAATGYAYRSVSEAATGWERAGLVRIDRGLCTLANPAPWCELLGCKANQVVVVDWQMAFQSIVEYLRTLARGRVVGLEPDHALLTAAAETARVSLEVARCGATEEQAPALWHLNRALDTTPTR